MMALHGLAFARHEDEWRIVLFEDEHATEATLRKPSGCGNFRSCRESTLTMAK